MTNEALSAARHPHLETNHERIWLSPRCEDERTWCEDDHGPCDNCGEASIEYVRADLHEAVKAELIAAREAVDRLTASLQFYAEPTNYKGSFVAGGPTEHGTFELAHHVNLVRKDGGSIARTALGADHAPD